MNVLRSLFDRIKYNKRYLWRTVRVQRESVIFDNLKSAYPTYGLNDACAVKKQVVCIYRGDIIQGGLADRLRGILSTYMVCKENKVEFKLFFKHPFDLELFLEPNYDWSICENEICNNLNKIDTIILDTTQDTEYQWKKQHDFLLQRISSVSKQTHMYTNAAFCYQSNYSLLFSELFKLTPRLQESIIKAKQRMGNDYISVSTRFLDLLNDFNETFGAKFTLTPEQQELLISSCLKQIEKLHVTHRDCVILVNSDSVTFLNRAKAYPYVYVNPGTITHIDNETSDLDCYEKYEKTFLDFFMISNARIIYQLKSGQMRRSGYPYAASLVYNKPFKTIEF